MIDVKIAGNDYKLFGNPKGQNSSKWNRATKLARRYEELDTKFRRMVKRGKKYTETKRCALALLLMMQTGIRVGNESSASGYMTKPGKFAIANGKKPQFVMTYGLTTLKKEHVRLTAKAVHLKFLGKKQVENKFVVNDAEIVKAFKNLLVDYDSDTLFGTTDYQINKFIKTYVGEGFTAKDFRCMKANLIAWENAQTYEWSSLKRRDFRKQLKDVFTNVADQLNNTIGVCKKSYVHEALPAYLLELNS